jgi:mannose-6-phosphate isomerase-like protein (cupin superfamily)
MRTNRSIAVVVLNAASVLAKVNAGDVLFVPAGAIHTAKNVGSGNGAELATYVVEKGKPLFTLVE